MNHVAYGPLGVNLLVTAGAVALLMAGTFALNMSRGIHAVMDIVWSLGFVVVAAVSFGLSAGHGTTGTRVLVLALTAIWGLRLAGYIWWRNRGRGEDPRYAALLRHAGDHPGRFALKNIYWAQGRVMWLVSLPVQVAMYERGGWVGLRWAGAVVWAVGLGCEALGDAQLARFRADPGNRGRILDRGLWSWTRHPNYFGDACVWWGLWLVAAGSWPGLATVVCPVVMTFMLVRKTGKALLEKTMRRSRGPAYEAYVARTSGFVPRPPRRVPAGVAGSAPGGPGSRP